LSIQTTRNATKIKAKYVYSSILAGIPALLFIPNSRTEYHESNQLCYFHLAWHKNSHLYLRDL